MNQRHGPRDDGPWFFMRETDFDGQVAAAVPWPQVATEPAGAAKPLLISVNELAQMLGVSTRTTWRHNSSGRIPSPIPVGGLMRWRRQEIEDWIAEGCPERRDWRWSRGKQIRGGIG